MDSIENKENEPAQASGQANEPASNSTAVTTKETKAAGHCEAPVITRRALCVGAGGMAALFGLGAIRIVGSDPLVRPPGGQDEAALLSACIRCEKCYEVCPRNVIAPAHVEDGLLNMRTPVMNFKDNWCDWCAEENDGVPLCAKVCPTNALKMGSTPQNTRLGVADLDYDLCLAYRLIGCRFCYDACQFEAMELDSNGRPYVIPDKCNGCGACEDVCVSMENGSIATGAKRRAIEIRAI